jgi:protein N-terminal methyltransferase
MEAQADPSAGAESIFSPGPPPIASWQQQPALLLKSEKGADSDGKKYDSVAAMWEFELSDQRASERSISWYSEGKDYWDDAKNCPTTDDGVLGGFGFVSASDITESAEFLQCVHKARPQMERAVAIDAGAGIGRVTKSLLLPLYQTVDVLEQSPRLLEAVPGNVGPENAGRIRNYLAVGMQVLAA